MAPEFPSVHSLGHPSLARRPGAGAASEQPLKRSFSWSYGRLLPLMTEKFSPYILTVGVGRSAIHYAKMNMYIMPHKEKLPPPLGKDMPVWQCLQEGRAGVGGGESEPLSCGQSRTAVR